MLLQLKSIYIIFNDVNHIAIVILELLQRLMKKGEVGIETSETLRKNTKIFPWSELKSKFWICSVCKLCLRSPKVLPCMHNFCLECLEHLVAEEHAGKFLSTHHICKIYFVN